ncbi:MAG: flagellar hook capping FlgD N-terminal domain-containing protein [Pseudomonadota bacterium]
MTTTMNIPTYTPGATTAIASKSQSEITSTDFLKLMTEQLKQQDPFAPQDNSQMVAQMAQMNASAASTEMSATLKSISSQLTDQTALLKTLSDKLTPTTTPAAA